MLFACVFACAPPAVCPNPSLPICSPNLSASLLCLLCEDSAATGVGLRIFPFSFAGAPSSSGLYPSFVIRSASSFAFFSASSKSTTSPALTFLAPSFWGFFAPRTPVRRAEEAVPAPLVRSAEEVVVRDTGGVKPPEVSGEVVRVASLLETRGEEVRPMTGGVAVRDGGGVGRLMEGLSHEEKKSSSASLGVAASSPPSMITSPGCLRGI